MPTPAPAVAHLLRRAGFGGTRDEIESLARLDIEEIVPRVVGAAVGTPLPDPPIVFDQNADWYARYVAMSSAWLDQMRVAPAGVALVEKMALFWHGHFCSSIDKVGDFPAMWKQNQLFRTMGLGSFRDLAQAVAIDHAMLRYLDNDRNVKGAPNENWARESMELFTLGVGNYTQDDVVASARAWTGHTYDKDGNHLFRAERHDTGLKTFLGITKNWDGPDVLDEIILRSKRDVCARFIATKVWSFFAYPNPAAEIVDAIADAYVRADLSIAALLKAVFLRPEFYEVTDGLVRSPIEYVVAGMKGAGLTCDQAHPEWWLEPMGQQPFRPPNVSGWKANAYWLSTSATWAKFAYAGHLRWNVPDGVVAGTSRLRPDEAVRVALSQFGVDDPMPTTVAAMEQWLRGERASTKWAERPNLIMLAMLSPEFQLA